MRMFQSRGALTNAEVSAVLGARVLDANRVEVSFMPVVIELTLESSWVVTGVRPSTP